MFVGIILEAQALVGAWALSSGFGSFGFELLPVGIAALARQIRHQILTSPMATGPSLTDIEGLDKTQVEKRPVEPDRFDPQKMRIVDVEKTTGEVLRRDCYDPDGHPIEMSDIMSVSRGTLWLRAVDWARSKSHSEEPNLKWEPTGLTREDVTRIVVYTWPAGTQIRIFEDE